MNEKIKRHIAKFQLTQILRKQKLSQKNFNKFFSLSKTVLLVFPLKDNSISDVDKLISFLIQKGKKVTVFSTIEYYNKISTMHECSLFEYTAGEINKLGLPNIYLQKRLNREIFDIVINLDFNNNIFNEAITKLSKVNYRIGFGSKQFDKFFNIQILKKNSEHGYLAIINALNLF